MPPLPRFPAVASGKRAARARLRSRADRPTGLTAPPKRRRAFGPQLGPRLGEYDPCESPRTPASLALPRRSRAPRRQSYPRVGGSSPSSGIVKTLPRSAFGVTGRSTPVELGRPVGPRRRAELVALSGPDSAAGSLPSRVKGARRWPRPPARAREAAAAGCRRRCACPALVGCPRLACRRPRRRDRAARRAPVP
jgi:hypothetical protein